MFSKIKALFTKPQPKPQPRPQLHQHPLIIKQLTKKLSRSERGELIALIKEHGARYSITEITALIVKRKAGQ